jgi:hypothetical protein
VKGAGDQIDYGMRGYDPRIGRFLSIDPLTRQYPWYSPFQYAGNKPIFAIDVDGLEEASTSATWWQKAQTIVLVPVAILANKLDWNVSTTGGYKGPMADVGQKVVTSAGSTLNGGLHAVTAGAWPLDPSATLGFTPAINPDASNVGQMGGAFIPGPFHGMPGANVVPSLGAPLPAPSVDLTLHLPFIVYSNSPDQSDENNSADNNANSNNSPQTNANRGGSQRDIVQIKAKDLQLGHKESTITGSADYQKIKKLSDKDLIESVLHPTNYDPVQINTKTGKLVNGNTRIYEIQRRGLDVTVPVKTHVPDDSAFPDLSEPTKR